MGKTKKGSDKASYGFDHDFQAEVLHLCLRNGTFLRQTRGALDAEFFSDPCHRVLAEETLQFFDKYGHPPSQGSVQELLRARLSGKPGTVGLASVRRSLTDVLAREKVVQEYVSQQVRDFAAQSAARNILVQAPAFFEAGDYEEFQRQLDKALMLRHEEPAAVPYNVGLEERIKSYKGGYRKQNPLPTGIDKMDRYLLGGLDRGELGVVLGIRGTGKSHCLVHLGATALEHNLKVWHITLEMSMRQLFRRYDQRLARLPDKELADKFKTVAKKLKDKDLKVFWYPSKRLTVSQIRSMLYRLGRPDLLIVDYGRLMRSETTGANRWEEIGDIYAGLRDLGTEFDIGVWSAAQVNRQAYERTHSEGDVITQEHLAESIQIADHADVIISFNQTRAEKDIKEARLWLDKGREGDDKKEVSVKADWAISLLE